MSTYRLVKLSFNHIDVKFNTKNLGVDNFWEDRYEHAEEGFSVFYVAEDMTGSSCGYFTLSIGSLYCTIDGVQKKWPMILLGQIGVDIEYQKLGIGEFLINQAIKISYGIYSKKEVGCRGLYLDVANDQKYLIEKWYPKVGFTEIETNRKLTSMYIDFLHKELEMHL